MTEDRFLYLCRLRRNIHDLRDFIKDFTDADKQVKIYGGQSSLTFERDNDFYNQILNILQEYLHSLEQAFEEA